MSELNPREMLKGVAAILLSGAAAALGTPEAVADEARPTHHPQPDAPRDRLVPFHG